VRLVAQGIEALYVERNREGSPGAEPFNMFSMCSDEEDALERYEKEVLPAFR